MIEHCRTQSEFQKIHFGQKEHLSLKLQSALGGGRGIVNKKKLNEFLKEYSNRVLSAGNYEVLCEKLQCELDLAYLWYTKRYMPAGIISPSADKVHDWEKSFRALNARFIRHKKMRDGYKTSAKRSVVFDDDMEVLSEFLRFCDVICYSEDWKHYRRNEPIELRHLDNIVDNLEVLEASLTDVLRTSPWITSKNKELSKNLSFLFDLHQRYYEKLPVLWGDDQSDDINNVIVKGDGCAFFTHIAEYYELDIPLLSALYFLKRYSTAKKILTRT